MLSQEQIDLTRRFKRELILEANALRVLKQDTKNAQREGVVTDGQWDIVKAKRKIRHRHLAYCMLRGKRYEQCEQKCRKDNKPNMELIKKIIWDYTHHVKIEETVPVAA